MSPAAGTQGADPSRVADFNRVAGIYTLIEKLVYGEGMHRARTVFLNGYRPAGPLKVLIMGEGPGRFLEQFAGAIRDIEIHIVEPSAAMRQLQKKRLSGNPFPGQNHDLHYYNLLEEIPANHSGSFDLVVTHFFLDMFGADEMGPLIGKLTSLASDSARWWWADFCLPPRKSRLKRLRAEILLKVMYRFFGLVSGLECRTLVPPDEFMIQSGWKQNRRRHFSGKFIAAAEWGRVNRL